MSSIPKTKLCCRDRSNLVWSVMKTRQDNDVTQRMGLVYVENDIELLRHIGSSVVFEETKHHNDETDHTGGSTPKKKLNCHNQ